ncbi:MAG TPA: response regulator [Chloroflexi bacterium]|nr:response regulator [Chloroflexota bacterium]
MVGAISRRPGCSGEEPIPACCKEAKVSRQVLAVDSNEAFAVLLKEGLESQGDYEVTIALDGETALQAMEGRRWDLVIVDLGLPEEDPGALIQAMRQRQPDLHLICIPVDEDRVPPEIAALDVQGVLTKPFFFPDLPKVVEEALSRPVRPAAPAPAGPEEPEAEVGEEAEMAPPSPAPPSPEQRATLQEHASQLTEHLKALSRELSADAILLTAGNELVAYAGRFRRDEVETLARLVMESWEAGARVAAALGREGSRFEQSLHEGADYLLYSLAATDDLILSVATRPDRPLGMVRYRTRETAQALRAVLGGS